MDARQIRSALTALYPIAVVLAVLLGDGTTVAVVAVVGAMIVGASYTVLSGGSGGVSSRPGRAARRSGRRRRRG